MLHCETWLNYCISAYSLYLSSPAGHTDANLEHQGESLLSGPIWLSGYTIGPNIGFEKPKNKQQQHGAATYTINFSWPFGKLTLLPRRPGV